MTTFCCMNEPLEDPLPVARAECIDLEEGEGINEEGSSAVENQADEAVDDEDQVDNAIDD